MSHLQANGDVGSEQSFTKPAATTTLTDVEVAARLGVSRFTVRSWRLKGVGPRFLKMGRAVRYRLQDVDEYERQALVETQARSDHGPMRSAPAWRPHLHAGLNTLTDVLDGR
jgi:excisionase family DNA binding protein